MAKIEQLNSYLTVKQRTDRDVRQLGVLVGESYEADSTDQQTVINLNFSIDINNKKQIWVFIDGQKLIEGGNYTFTNIVNGLSAQITLTAPIIAGLPIQVYKLGAYQEQLPNPSSVTATLLNDVAQPHKMAQDAFNPFVKKELIIAPYSTIINRAKVEAHTLKAIMGVERVHCRGIVLSRTEFGQNGEPVYEVDSKESRIRIVGSSWYASNTTNGSRLETVGTSDYVEITYYGTGLNLLTAFYTTQDARASIDGAAEVATNIFPTSYSTILGARNYNQNIPLPIVSGQTLGWHTVKIRNNSANGFPVHGFEVLNQRTDLAVLSGTAYNGMKQEVLNALSTSAYNAGVVGTRGARVVKYLKDGAISQVVQEVNASVAYMSLADHTNEEVIRKIGIREFGAQRADDFSTALSARAAAFTLDDGTTTLVTDNAIMTDGVGLAPNGLNNFVTITFIGTGLDILSGIIATATSQIIIDGVTVAASALYFNTVALWKICSGLPYGTHTVKFQNTSNATSLRITDFIIYGPKKPVLPSGAIELVDYCVMANFVANAVAGIETLATGVMRKFPIREFTYVGSWLYDTTFGTTGYIGGGQMYSLTAGNYFEYTFFGTGFDLRFKSFTTYGTGLIALNGTTLTATNFATASFGAVGLSTGFNSSTGILSWVNTANTSGAGFKCSGLPLGKYTIRITVQAATTISMEAFDIITPIHMNNTRVGSLSLKDTRVFSPIVDEPEKIDLTKAKAFIAMDTVNNKILASQNISAFLKTATGIYNIYFEKQFKNASYIVVPFCQARGTSGRVHGVFEDIVLYKDHVYLGYYTTTNGAVVSPVADDTGYISIAFFGELEDEQEF